MVPVARSRLSLASIYASNERQRNRHALFLFLAFSSCRDVEDSQELRVTSHRFAFSRLTFPPCYDNGNIYMLFGLSLAHSNGFSPPTGHRRDHQSQPNPLHLSLVDSAICARNRDRQTHCAYPACFQQLNTEKGSVFRTKIVVHRAPKPANPLHLTSIYSVTYPRNARRQTHCGHLACFQQLKSEKGPVFRKKMAAWSWCRPDSPIVGWWGVRASVPQF